MPTLLRVVANNVLRTFLSFSIECNNNLPKLNKDGINSPKIMPLFTAVSINYEGQLVEVVAERARTKYSAVRSCTRRGPDVNKYLFVNEQEHYVDRGRRQLQLMITTIMTISLATATPLNGDGCRGGRRPAGAGASSSFREDGDP